MAVYKATAMCGLMITKFNLAGVGRTAVLLILLSTGVEAAETKYFTLHSNIWINLHHFLYHAARNRLRGDEELRGRLQIYPEDDNIILTPNDELVWQQALKIYAEYGDRHLLFDEDLTRLKNTIPQGVTAFINGPTAEPAYQALQMAMPIYEKYWWPKHRETNLARIQELEELLTLYEEPIAATLASEYESSWGDTPTRVDISVYANWAGAYASAEPNHLVVASPSDQHPGLLGLEILFHEASHTDPLGQHIIPKSSQAAAEVGIEEARVWHSFIFYAAGEAIRTAVSSEYVPYAYNNGLWDRGNMATHRDAIESAFSKGSLVEQFVHIHQKRLESSLDTQH